MPNLTMSIPHQLGRAEAKRRLEDHLGQVEKQIAGMVDRFDHSWQGDTLTFGVGAMGQTVKGQAWVEDAVVRVEVELPWLLSALSGTFRQQIEEKVRLALEPAKEK